MRRAGLGVLMLGALVLLVSWLAPERTPTQTELVQHAVHDLSLRNTWLRRSHTAMWNLLPDRLAYYLPALAPADLDQIHLAAARELFSLAPQSTAAVECLISMLDAQPHDLQRTVIEALAAIGPSGSAAVEPLLRLLQEAPKARITELPVFQALGAIAPTDPRVISALLQALRDPGLRFSAGNVLRQNADQYDESLRGKLARLSAEIPELKTGLAAVMGRIRPGSEETCAFLQASLKDTDRSIRQAAADALVERPVLRPEFATALSDNLRALGRDEFREPVDWSHLADSTRMPIPRLDADREDAFRRQQRYWEAVADIEALGKMRAMAAAAEPILRELFPKGDARFRIVSGIALWRISGDEEPLKSAFRECLSPNSTTKGLAIRELRTLTTEWNGVFEFWRLALADPDKHFRYISVQTLGSLGPVAKPILPDLRKRLADPVASIREITPLSIGSITLPEGQRK